MLVEQMLPNELRSLELLAAEGTQPTVDGQHLCVVLNEFLDLFFPVLDAQLLGRLLVQVLFVLEVGLHLGLELLDVLVDFVLGGLLAAGHGRTCEHYAAAVGHRVLLLVFCRVVEVE